MEFSFMSSKFDRSESFINQLENTATAGQSAVSAAKLLDYILGQKPELGNGKGNDNIAKNLIPNLEFDVCCATLVLRLNHGLQR